MTAAVTADGGVVCVTLALVRGRSKRRIPVLSQAAIFVVVRMTDNEEES